MNRQEIISQIHRKQSFLCVGLDSDIKKIPSHLLETDDPIFEFNRQIIDATKEFCVSYKPNLAFYESLGPKGMVSLEKTIKYISKDIFTIADAKRGDIGNTSELYARSFFEYYGFDSVTVAPYMGSDSVTPFLKIPGKWVILLALTSNEGALDFQMMNLESKNKKLFEEVLDKSKEWGTKENMMYVVGATRGEAFSQVRKSVPENFLLVPGVGAQGGSLKDVVKFGKNKDCGLLVNSSRNILYADSGKSFADAAAEEALKLQKEMRDLL